MLKINVPIQTTNNANNVILKAFNITLDGILLLKATQCLFVDVL